MKKILSSPQSKEKREEFYSVTIQRLEDSRRCCVCAISLCETQPKKTRSYSISDNWLVAACFYRFVLRCPSSPLILCVNCVVCECMTSSFRWKNQNRVKKKNKIEENRSVDESWNDWNSLFDENRKLSAREISGEMCEANGNIDRSVSANVNEIRRIICRKLRQQRWRRRWFYVFFFVSVSVPIRSNLTFILTSTLIFRSHLSIVVAVRL